MPLALSPYQQTAVEAFRAPPYSGRMILHADGGIGKTPISLAAAYHYAQGPILFLCPAAIKEQVAGENVKFTDLPHAVVKGDEDARRVCWKIAATFKRPMLFIANYELLTRDQAYIKSVPWDMIIVDECQQMKNSAAKSVKFLKKLTPRLRLAMSGTPAPNEIHELYSMADWVRPAPELGRTFWEFKMKHCIPNPYIPGKIDGYRNETELRKILAASIYRIKADDVLTDDLKLPELTEQIIKVPLSEEERQNYETLKKDMVLQIKGQKDLTVTSAITLLIRLRQMVSAPSIHGLSPEISAKHQKLIEIIEEKLRDPQNKIIIFSELTSVIQHLMASFPTALVITGNTTQKTRLIALETFKTEKYSRILLMSSAGQYGLNITEANIVIHFDLTWNAARHSQRVWRAHRRGQTKPVESIILLAENTVDEKMYSVIKRKEKLTKEILLDALE